MALIFTTKEHKGIHKGLKGLFRLWKE